MPWLLPWLWWTLTCHHTTLQKANMGEQQDGSLLPFYQCSILHKYLLISLVISSILTTHSPFPPLIDPFIYLLFEAPTLMAGRAVAVISVSRSLWRCSEPYPLWHGDVWDWDVRQWNTDILKYFPLLIVAYLCFGYFLILEANEEQGRHICHSIINGKKHSIEAQI